jgi:hypothetical protein
MGLTVGVGGRMRMRRPIRPREELMQTNMRRKRRKITSRSKW